MRKQKINFNLKDQDLQLLPHDEDLEKKVLGFMANVPEAFQVGLRYLNAEGLFYYPLHEDLWVKMRDLSNRGIEINLENLKRGYSVAGKKDEACYVQTLGIYATWWTDANSFHKYCLILNEYWIKRSMCRVGHHVNQEALNASKDALELLGEASEGMDSIYQHIGKMNEVSMDDAATELYKSIVEASNGLLGQPSTLKELNKIIKGYRRANLIVLAASTHEGKTTLALQDAYNLVAQKIPVGYISLEMQTSELMLMMACTNLGFDIGAAMEGLLNVSDSERLSLFVEALKKMPIKISDKPAIKIGEAKAMARTWKKNNDIKALFVDHMHLMYDDIEHGSNSEQRFTNIANKLKELAKELNIPVIALAQLSRKEKSERTKPHVISDLKYAGGIEQAADVIILLFRPELHGVEKDMHGNSTKGQAIIMVPKLRLLPKRDFKCTFTGLKFQDNEYFIEPTNHYRSFQKTGTDDKPPF